MHTIRTDIFGDDDDNDNDGDGDDDDDNDGGDDDKGASWKVNM